MSYVPFYEKFLNIAENETRSIIIHNDPELPNDQYAFVEAYCDEEDCDCRRVFFNVISEKSKKLLAVITYGWEKRAYYIKWMGDNDPKVIDSLVGLGLNSASPQSKFANALLKKIDFVLKNDKNYVERIKGHYKIFKEKIDKENKKEPFISLPKIERNELCPCGSGKKFKKCCIDKNTNQNNA
jgi:preprotein translocase subunit SecA